MLAILSTMFLSRCAWCEDVFEVPELGFDGLVDGCCSGQVSLGHVVLKHELAKAEWGGAKRRRMKKIVTPKSYVILCPKITP